MKRVLTLFLAVLLLTGTVLGAVSCKPADEEDKVFNFLTEDLTPYVTVDAAAYTNMQLDILFDYVTEIDVEEAIGKVLYSFRDTTPKNDGAGMTDGEITLGDEAYVYFRGYLLEDGKKTYFNGGSNLTSPTPQKLQIGSMGFISGFESALLGKNPADMVKIKTTGPLVDGDYVSASYLVKYPDGVMEYKTDRFLFSKTNEVQLNATYGEDFYQTLVDAGMEYGGGTNENSVISTASFAYSSDEHGTGMAVYQDFVITFGTDRADEPLLATTYFPASYHMESLRCKTAYFEIYLDYTKNYVVQYDTPTLDDDFILNVAKISAEELAGYEGATLVEQYRSMVRALLEGDEQDRQDAYDAAVYDAILAKLEKAGVVHAYPEQAMEDIIQPLREELAAAYKSYGSSYGYTDIEAFAKDYFEYTKGSSEEYFESLAKETVKSRLVFYSVARTKGLVPPEGQVKADAEAMKQEYLQQYIEYYDYDREDYASDESYQLAIDQLFDDMMDYYGETYFIENARYLAIMKGLAEGAQVNVLGRQDPQ